MTPRPASQDALKAVKASEASLAEVKGRWPEVNQVHRQVTKASVTNNFAARIAQAYREGSP